MERAVGLPQLPRSTDSPTERNLMTFADQGDGPAFTPRLQHDDTPAPYNPSAYVYVAFLGGVLPMAWLALVNVGRFPKVAGLAQKTQLAVGFFLVANVILLLMLPVEWLSGNSEIRMLSRVVGVVASAALYAIHRVPAFGGVQRHDGDYSSAWKSFLPLLGFAILQAIVVFILASARGLT